MQVVPIHLPIGAVSVGKAEGRGYKEELCWKPLIALMCLVGEEQYHQAAIMDRCSRAPPSVNILVHSRILLV